MQSYVKDLSVLGRDPRKVLIVDNSPQAFSLDVNNGVPIRSWFGDDTDDELHKLETLLDDILAIRSKIKKKSLAKMFDLREVMRKKFRFQELVEELYWAGGGWVQT